MTATCKRHHRILSSIAQMEMLEMLEREAVGLLSPSRFVIKDREVTRAYDDPSPRD